jgi:hypothetical protein
MNQSFEIVSYLGAKPLLFGMTQDQVEALVGPPQMIRHDFGETNALYEFFSVRYSKQGKTMVEVGFSKPVNVTILGINPFTQKNGFRDLLREDSCPYESYGFIVLLNLGITLTGFHDNDPNQLAITAFTRGRWDDSKSEFRKFPVP